MSENFSGWIEQFEKDMRGDGVARLVFRREIDNGAAGEKLDAGRVFLHAYAGLRMGRGHEEKTHEYGFEETTGLVTHRPHPRLRMRYKQRLIIGCVEGTKRLHGRSREIVEDERVQGGVAPRDSYS